MTTIKRYVVQLSTLGEKQFCAVFSALLSAYEPVLARGNVDVIAGSDDLPDRVQEAHVQLRAMAMEARGKRRRGGWAKRLLSLPSDPLMAVDLDLKAERQLQLLNVFGPFSIHACVFVDGHAEPVMTVDDSTTIIFEADEATLAMLREKTGLARESVEELA